MEKGPLTSGGEAAWIMESAAELVAARSVDAAQRIVAGMAARLLDAQVAIDITGEGAADPAGVVLPIEGPDGATLGLLRVSRAGDRPFSTEDLALLGQLARLTGARLESLRLFEREHRLAATLQGSLIPARMPEVPGLMLAAHYSPGNPEADVGGDWYDALALPGGGLAIAAGDVVGRGVHAAAIMGQLRNAFRAFLLEGYTPADALGRLNRLVHTLGDAYFCTVACMLIDPARGFARVAAAGHPPPIVVTDEGSARFQDLVASIAIGAVEEADYADTALMLHPGDTLLLYTDGLVERRGRSLDDGLDRLLGAAGAAGGDPAVLVDHVVRTMTQIGHGEDDVAAIALTTLPDLEQPMTLRLPAHPAFIGALRRRLRERLLVMGMSKEDAFDVVLAVSEATANAMEHAADPTSPSISVTATPADGRVVLSVKDYGRWKDAAPEHERGRGLGLIEALLEAPSIERSPEGTIVTFRAAITGGHP